MKIVIIISPYSGEVESNVAYAEAALFDCLMRREAPFASHLLYTRVLDDTNPDHREMGMLAGQEIILRADHAAVYMDHGISDGMKKDISFARRHRLPILQRWLSRYSPVDGSGDTPLPES